MSYQIRSSKIFYLLVIAVVLSMLMLLIPATPALAQPGIALSPSSGSIGTKVTLTGTNFESFIVQGPEIEIYPGDGIVGTEVTIKGKGFYAGGTVTVYYRDAATANLGNETASAIGEFTYTFSVPDSAAGVHQIVVEDVLGDSAEASFRVFSAIAVSSSSGAIGDSVTVTGNGFGGESDVTISLNNVEVARDGTNQYGSFEVTFAVSVVESGSYHVKIEDAEAVIILKYFPLLSGEFKEGGLPNEI